MNIIRTKAVELTAIPAIAYKQKLSSGGAGIKLMRIDSEQSAVCTIDRRSGEAVPYSKFDESLFPPEAFDEALELTDGLPYSARGNISVKAATQLQKDDVAEEAPAEQVDMTLSPEYKAIVERYSDEKGKMNYKLMNKEFIQFAAKSKTVADLISGKASQDEILTFIIKSRAALAAGSKDSLDDASTALLIETLDEIDPRSAFKELKTFINRLLAKSGKA